MVTFISNYWDKGLSIMWSLCLQLDFGCSCWVAVNWSTALPHGAGTLSVAAAPAMGSCGSSHSKTHHLYALSMVWHWASYHSLGTTEDGSSAEEELVRPHRKTASGPTFQVAGNPAKQQKLLLVLRSFISHHKYKRSTQAGICSNALSKHCAIHPAVSNRLWQCHAGDIMLHGWQSLLLLLLAL